MAAMVRCESLRNPPAVTKAEAVPRRAVYTWPYTCRDHAQRPADSLAPSLESVQGGGVGVGVDDVVVLVVSHGSNDSARNGWVERSAGQKTTAAVGQRHTRGQHFATGKPAKAVHHGNVITGEAPPATRESDNAKSCCCSNWQIGVCIDCGCHSRCNSSWRVAAAYCHRDTLARDVKRNATCSCSWTGDCDRARRRHASAWVGNS